MELKGTRIAPETEPGSVPVPYAKEEETYNRFKCSVSVHNAPKGKHNHGLMCAGDTSDN